MRDTLADLLGCLSLFALLAMALYAVPVLETMQ